jgi:ketosteroid isomerase-like protein
VSQDNVEVVRRGFEHLVATGEPLEDIYAPGFVWDMTTFRDLMGLPPRYEGVDGVRRFLEEWTEPFDEWRIELEALHDAGEKVVAVCQQHARAKASGLPVKMRLAMVFTVQDGLETRMEMYAEPAEALRAAGLEE